MCAFTAIQFPSIIQSVFLFPFRARIACWIVGSISRIDLILPAVLFRLRYQLSETEEAEVHQFARGQTSMHQRELQAVVLESVESRLHWSSRSSLQKPYIQ